MTLEISNYLAKLLHRVLTDPESYRVSSQYKNGKWDFADSTEQECFDEFVKELGRKS